MILDHFFPFPDYPGPQVCVCGVRWCGEADDGPFNDGVPLDVAFDKDASEEVKDMYRRRR